MQMPEETQTVILIIHSYFGVRLSQRRIHYALLLWAAKETFQEAFAFFTSLSSTFAETIQYAMASPPLSL